MVLTKGAIKELKKLLMAQRHSPQERLRLKCKGMGQLGFVLSQAKDGDQVIVCDGQQLLLIDSELEALLNETILTVSNTSGKREFVIGKSRNTK